MPYKTRIYESTSPSSLLSASNAVVAAGWEAFRFETVVSGWIFKTYTYRITFRRRIPPAKPGVCSIRVADEDDLMLQFFVDLPAKTADEFDVVSRKVEIEVGGVLLEPHLVPVETLEIGPFQGQQDMNVKVRCWNVDDAGNTSETASEFDGILLDTFAPPAPGQLGIRVTGETPDQVTPEVPVEPTPETPVDPVPIDPTPDEPEETDDAQD